MTLDVLKKQQKLVQVEEVCVCGVMVDLVLILCVCCIGEAETKEDETCQESRASSTDICGERTRDFRGQFFIFSLAPKLIRFLFLFLRLARRKPDRLKKSRRKKS